MTDLAEFLLARIAEERAAAEAASKGPWTVVNKNDGYDSIEIHGETGDPSQKVVGPGYEGGGVWKRSDAAHIACWDPARVLAECEAKRYIVRMCAEVLRAFEDRGGGMWPDVNRRERSHAHAFLIRLTKPYMDHPDYREEWSSDA